MDFRGGSVVKNLPANAGDVVWSLIQEGSTCWEAAKPVLQGLCATTPEACAPENLCSPRGDTMTVSSPREAPAHNLGKACTAMKTQHSRK